MEPIPDSADRDVEMPILRSDQSEWIDFRKLLMGKIAETFKKSGKANFLNPMHRTWAHGGFDRKEVGDFDAIAGKGKGMTKQQKADYRAREALKKNAGTGLAVQSPLTSLYS